jgi:hypothetical protein
MFTADYLLGRRFTMNLYLGNTIAGSLDITIVGFDPANARVRVHSDDGQKEYWSLDDVRALIQGGGLVESINGAPFVNR